MIRVREVSETNGPPSRTASARRVAVGGLIAFLAMNVWTGAPLLALWAGALVAGEQSLSMRGVCVAVLVLAAVAYAIAVVITKLSQLYDELAERPRTSDIRQSWLRSMRAEEKSEIAAREGVTAPDVIVVLNVCIAIASLIAWYALLASTPFSLVV